MTRQVRMMLESLGVSVEFGETARGCWLWRGSVHGPYFRPVMWVKRKPQFLRRLVWEQVHDRPLGRLFLHAECGQSRCCNPTHMRTDTGGRSGKMIAKPPRTHWFETNALGCWLWTGKLMPSGYGKVMIGGHAMLAHRRAYEVHYGTSPDKNDVLHTCDTPPCCNPSHLALGTARDNAEQMAQRQRAGSQKLSPSDVAVIRERLATGEPLRLLATAFNVSHRTIHKIKHGWGYGRRRSSRVLSPPPKPDTPCWEWMFTGSQKYGYVKIDGRNYLVHRRAWELVNGPIPEGKVVRHLCDTPRCIRVDHLALGTYQDNSDDANGRQRGTHKLAPHEVEQIRHLREHWQFSYARLGALFKIDSTSVMRLCRGETYNVRLRRLPPPSSSTVVLAQLDGKLPNMAIMRLAQHFKNHGDSVEFVRWSRPSQLQMGLFGDRAPRIFASALFSRTRPLVDALRSFCPTAVIGGTGGDPTLRLESLGVTDTALDYSLYPGFSASIGFTQRGCRLKCPFCVVPTKEGPVQAAQSIAEIWRGEPWPRHVILLDNDFFGQADWRTRMREIRDGGFRVSFNQGINARLIGDEEAEALASVKYYDDQFRARRLYTAWDNRKDEQRLFAGLHRLVRYGVKPEHIMVYMLIGYWPNETSADREYRRATLRAFGCRPYPMPYVRTQELIGFQRWVIGAYDKRVSWKEWETARYRPENCQLAGYEDKEQMSLLSS